MYLAMSNISKKWNRPIKTGVQLCHILLSCCQNAFPFKKKALTQKLDHSLNVSSASSRKHLIVSQGLSAIAFHYPAFISHRCKIVLDWSAIAPDHTAFIPDCAAFIPDCAAFIPDCAVIVPDCSSLLQSSVIL